LYNDALCVVELHGLTQIKLYDLDTCWLTQCGRGHSIAVLATQEALHPLPLSLAWRGNLLSGQSTDQTMRVMEGAATPVADWPYIQAFQVTVLETVIAVLHCLHETRVRVRYCAISGHSDIARLPNLRSISRYYLIDMNP